MCENKQNLVSELFGDMTLNSNLLTYEFPPWLVPVSPAPLIVCNRRNLGYQGQC